MRNSFTAASVYTPPPAPGATQEAAWGWGKAGKLWAKCGGCQQRTQRWYPSQHGRRKTALYFGSWEFISGVECDARGSLLK